MTRLGTVKFFDSDRAFGFINSDDGEEVFCHASNVEIGTHLAKGDRVSFVIGKGRDGRDRAQAVKRIEL